jgi:NADH-quinone oxidoreductase subunit F
LIIEKTPRSGREGRYVTIEIIVRSTRVPGKPFAQAKYNEGLRGGSLATPSSATSQGWDGAELIGRLDAAGLRGRGGGWFPAARKWAAVRAEGGEPLVVGNGAEGEPGSIKDRHVMRRRPGDVLTGLALAARAVGAREAVVFLKGSFEEPEAALRAALAAAPSPGLEVSIRRGDDSYVAGEETAVLEALEGKRAWPRPKPPLPCAVGYKGRPTLVQNVETLARVADALQDPAAFRRSEATYVSIWGHVRRPGVAEVRLGTPLAQVVEQFAQGPTDGIGMLFPAGPSAAPLARSQAETPLDPDALRAAGSGLGTASLLVLGRAACPVSLGVSLAAFFEREACGQCPPCTVGTANLHRVVAALEHGGARSKDLHDLAEAAGFMSGHGYCSHARTAAASVTGLLRRFPADVEEHLRAGRCPRPEGQLDPFAEGSAERRAIEELA